MFPSPTVARYTGSGSIDDVANFIAWMPRRDTVPDYNWVGKPLCSRGYQTTCEAMGTQLHCERARVLLGDR